MTFILTEMFPTKEQQLLAVVKPLGALQNEVQKRPPQKTKIYANEACMTDKIALASHFIEREKYSFES